MPEPMKSEMLAAVDVVEMKRLGGGKVSCSPLFLLTFCLDLRSFPSGMFDSVLLHFIFAFLPTYM